MYDLVAFPAGMILKVTVPAIVVQVASVPNLGLNIGPVRDRVRATRGESMSVAVTLTDIQQVLVSLVFVDAEGNVTSDAPDAPPAWSSSDPAIVTVSPADDGMTATLSTVGPEGQATVTVDATVGGTALPSLAVMASVVGSAPTSLTATVGTPTTRPGV